MSVRMRKPWHQWVEQLFSDESVEAQVHCSWVLFHAGRVVGSVGHE